MKGISKRPFPYIVKAEQAMPKAEQTVFWIKPNVGDRSAEAQAIIERNKSPITDSKGKEVFDKNLSYRTSKELWLHFIDHIDNYQFHETSQFYRDGYIHETITEQSLLLDLMEGLESDIIGEIVEIAMKPSQALKRVEEKKVGDHDVAGAVEGSR